MAGAGNCQILDQAAEDAATRPLLAVPTIVLAELRYGIARMPAGAPEIESAAVLADDLRSFPRPHLRVR